MADRNGITYAAQPFGTHRKVSITIARGVVAETGSRPYEYLRPLKEKKETKLEVHAKDDSRSLVPVTIAAIIAVLGTVGMLLIHFGPGSVPEGRGDGMISAATAERAGAIITPSVPELSVAPTPPGPRPRIPASGPKRGI